MALIICPMCGRQIVERVKECPGCGYPLGHLMLQEDPETQEEPEIPQDTRTELEKLVDEICARNDNMYAAIKELRKATGMDLQSADDIMRKKYKGVTRKEEKEALKHKRKSTVVLTDLSRAKAACCPKCRSISISYQEQGDGKGYVVCLNCGERWNL